MALDGKEPGRSIWAQKNAACWIWCRRSRACGREATVTYQPIPNDDPKQRCPDITRARELLNWSPTVSLQEGLQRTVSWFQNQT